MDDTNLSIPNNPQGQNITDIVYGTGLTVGFILILVFIIGFSSYIYNWRTRPLDATSDASTDSEATEKSGLDEVILLDSTKLLYSEAKLQRNLGSAACSICLADYEETDVLRLLPECNHLFHLKCVDPWLRLKHTCPMCRNSPMGTSLATPAAAEPEAATLRILTQA